MTYHPDDTICAIATAAGGAARGIVRVSGPGAVDVVAACFAAADGRRLSEVRRAEHVGGSLKIDLAEGAKPQVVPCELFVWPTSRSYTREPVVELHTFGSPPILEAVLASVCRGGARLAEPGEFTLRAFLAGRIDLTQAEAVVGVIDAQGDRELKAALAQLAGGLAQPLNQLRDQLLQLLAELEAGLDFVDEDIEFITSADLVAHLDSAVGLLRQVFEQMARRGTAGMATQVVLFGPPNVGKSSLFNALVAKFGKPAQESTERWAAALVSAQRGTTRDYLTATVEFGGVRCELVDTAGVDEIKATQLLDSTHLTMQVHDAAQAIVAERRKRAAIRVWCMDGVGDEVSAIGTMVKPSNLDCDLIVVTKADLSLVASPMDSPDCLGKYALPVIVTSSVTGKGLDELRDVLRSLLTRESRPAQEQVVAATADRCRESVRLAEESLQRAKAIAREDAGNELVAVELREALAELGKVVGAVYTDDLLDRIFKTFCIGK